MEEAQCVCVAFALVNMPPEVVNQTCCKVNDNVLMTLAIISVVLLVVCSYHISLLKAQRLCKSISKQYRAKKSTSFLLTTGSSREI